MKFFASHLRNIKIHLLLLDHFPNFSPSNSLNSWIVTFYSAHIFCYTVVRWGETLLFPKHIVIYCQTLIQFKSFHHTIPVLPFYSRVERKSDNPDYLGHLFFIWFTWVCVSCKISVWSGSVIYFNVAIINCNSVGNCSNSEHQSNILKIIQAKLYNQDSW